MTKTLTKIMQSSFAYIVKHCRPLIFKANAVLSVLDFSYAQLLLAKVSSLTQKHPHTLYTYDGGRME